MANPAGESESGSIRLDFDRRLMVQFRGSVVTSDAGLLAYRELDDALGLTAMASEALADARTGKNGRHALAGLFRQSVFGADLMAAALLILLLAGLHNAWDMMTWIMMKTPGGAPPPA